MKKYLIIATISLMAFSCGRKPAAQVQPQVQANNNQPASSAPVSNNVQKTPAGPKPVPLTLKIYSNTQNLFKVNYTSNFVPITSQTQENQSFGKLNASGCNSGQTFPIVCFVLSSSDFANTNLSSAVMSVTVLKDKTDISQCGVFDAQTLGNGQLTRSVTVNGVVFVTAKTTDAAAGTYSESHLARAFYNDRCFQSQETVRWTNAGTYSPPRQEFDRTVVWQKLDAIFGGLRLAN